MIRIGSICWTEWTYSTPPGCSAVLLTELETIIACGWLVNCVFATLDRAVPVPPDGDGARGAFGLEAERLDEAIRGEAGDDLLVRRRGLAV
jgi:hypothetical protein